MADEKIVTSIVANSDFSNLIADVQRVTGSLSKLQQEFAGANRALAGQINAANSLFSDTMRKTGQYSTHFVSLTSDVEKFGRNLDSGRLKLKDYFRVYQENVRTSGGLIRDLAKQQVQLQNAVLQPLGRNAQGLMQYNVHIPRGLDLTKNKAALLKQELQIMNKVIQDGGVQLINWGKNTQWAGRQLTVGLTLPLAAFGKAAADAFKQADQELTRLTKVYGDVAGTSSQELGKIRKEVAQTAKELSATMGVSFTETIGLAADIAATGKTGNDLLGSIKETTRLAVLGEVDRQEAMKATLALQSAFKINTEDLADSINFLNAVENQTSTTLNDLVEAIPKAGPVIKGLGGNVQDLALYLTAMREGGINASEGANALKSALASLINPTDVAVGKFQSFGIDLLGIVQKNAGSTTDTLFALQAALDKLNPLQKQQAIEQLFGKFQYSRLNALFENLGRQGSQTLQVLDLMKASASELQSVAGRELAAVTESASGRYKRALETLKAELAGVGDKFLDIGTKLINVLSKVLDFAQKLPDPIKKLLAFGGAFTAIIGPVIMLTGVLANFFGYIIKGLGHFKALFKGAEGFKLLTPEIMAAKAASSQLADEFYSDALAADTLSAAIKKLNNDLKELQINAGTIKGGGTVGQVVSTIAGTPIVTMGGRRIVDPQHPLVGGESRAAAHINPRNPNDPASIFGLSLQPIPVNRTIGRTPQVFMNERLPDIEGLTSVGGVSTGIVAGEHSKYAALMATLGMQSKQEIEQLKKTIGLGGQVSSEFIATFDDILPITQRLTQNAAAQSAAIVADLRAGKLNVEQARAAIIAANADLERMMGAEVTAYAASRGRTIDLTKAPLIDQPVVDVAGKPNTRGMFRKGIFGKVMRAVGRATGTRTYGGPYSIETTRPNGLNRGGKVPGYTNGDYVYMTNGETVPGPNVNADVVPAMLTPGEFVLTRDVVAQQGSDNVQALHEGRAMIVPFGANNGGKVPGFQYLNGGGPLSMLFRARAALIGGARKAGSRSTRALNGASPERMIYEQMRNPSGTRGSFWAQSPLLREGAPGSEQVVGHLYTNEYKKLMSKLGATPSSRGSSPQLTIDQLRAAGITVNSAGKVFDILPNNVMTFGRSFNTKLGKGTATSRDWLNSNPQPEHLTGLTHFLLSLGFGEDDIRQIRKDVLLDVNSKVSRIPGRINEYQFGNLVTGSIRSRLRNLNMPQSMPMAANRGGRVARYNRGGSVRYGYARGVQRKVLGGPILRMLAMMGLPMLGQTVGSKVGGVAGSAISAGSFMAPMFMMGSGFGGRPPINVGQRLGISQEPISMARQSIFSRGGMLGGFSEKVGTAATSGQGFSRVLGKIAVGATRLNVGLTVLAATVGAGLKIWNNYKDALERTRLASGLTEESAGKLGLKFKSYGNTIKETVAANKLWLDQNKAIYEGMTSAKTPFNMTITQYKNLRKEVKNTMQAQIDLINNTKKADLSTVATQLKAAFVSAGMSAEEASRKIYTAFTLSNKAADAYASTVGNRAFNAIQDRITAIKGNIDTFNRARKEFKDSEAQFIALDTAMQGMSNAIDASVDAAEKKANKDKTNFNEAEARIKAEKDLMKDLAGVKFEPIGQEALDKLAAADASILKIYKSADTLKSMMQKTSLINMGFTGDLLKFDTDEIDRIYTYASDKQAEIVKQNKDGVLKGKYQELEGLRKAITAAENAAKGESIKTQVNRKNRIKYLEDEIKKINEAADARKKALQQEAEDQDLNTEIQKKRLEYQQRLAAGDMAGAAQAQLDLQKAIGAQQRVITERSIEEKRAADIAPFQAELDKLNKAASDASDAAAIAGESALDLQKKFDALKTNIDNFNKDMLALILDKAYNNGKQLDEIGAAAISFGKALGLTEEQLRKILNLKIPTSVTAKSPDEAIGQYKAGATPSPDTTGAPAANKPGPQIKTYNYNAGTDLGFFTEAELKKANIERKRGTTFVGSDGKTYYLYNWDDINSQWQYKLAKVQPKYASGGHIRSFYNGTTDGPVSGPGSWTSDSIVARLSNGEFVTKSSSVADAGVDRMHLINQKGSAGIVQAAMSIIAENGGMPGFKDGGQAGNKSFMGVSFEPGTVSAMLSLASKFLGYYEKAGGNKFYKYLTGVIGSNASTVNKTTKAFEKWCGLFIATVAKITGLNLPNVVGTESARASFIASKRWKQTPQPGDLAFFDFGKLPNRTVEHVGLVEDVLGSKAIKTIEGNTSDTNQAAGGRVARKIRPFGPYNPQLGIYTRGFGRPQYKGEAPVAAGFGKEMIPLSVTSMQSPEGEYTTKGIYNVKRGDTLYDIAKTNGLTVGQLLKANPNLLSDPRYNGGRTIFKGTQLNIPGFKDGGFIGKKPGSSFGMSASLPSVSKEDKALQNFMKEKRKEIENLRAVIRQNINNYTPPNLSSKNDEGAFGGVKRITPEWIQDKFISGYFDEWYKEKYGKYPQSYYSSRGYKYTYDTIEALEYEKYLAQDRINQILNHPDYKKGMAKGFKEGGEVSSTMGTLVQMVKKSRSMQNPFGFAEGGYVGKMHSWNGTVPGPYGKEVSAVLKAGTEGVYQTDYIKSLQNDTIGGAVYNISNTINASPDMDIEQISNITTRKTIAAIKQLETVNAGKVGRNRSV